jgi:hypothetical protein
MAASVWMEVKELSVERDRDPVFVTKYSRFPASVKLQLKGFSMSERKRRRKAPKGMQWVFCREFRHWRSGQMVRRKNGKCFAFLVRR